MSKGITQWLALYRRALQESDPAQLTIRITEAQRAIRRRARELWYGEKTDIQERQRLDAASYFLRLLRTMGGKKCQESNP
jgi:hypothetical protein